MSSYFDRLAKEADEAIHSHANPQEAVAAIEAGMIREVTLVTGDREFPDDLRQQILTQIARWHIGTHAGLSPMAEALEWFQDLKSSRLITELHSLFHAVASRRIKTRFGGFSDNPAGDLKARTAWETETDYSNGHPVRAGIEQCSCGITDGPCVNERGEPIP